MGQGIYHPPDVLQGERYYNPFPFDVGCLGNLCLNWLNVRTFLMLDALTLTVRVPESYTGGSPPRALAGEDDDARCP